MTNGEMPIMNHAKLGNGIELAFEIHGDPASPVIFPILGITDNITDWPPGLYQPLVDAGFCVICHELRDSGLSTKIEHFGPADLPAAQASLGSGQLPDAPYTIHDVAKDALLLLDYLSVEQACVVGYSYGSAVAQSLALEAPSRVASLVCLQGTNYDPALPPRQARVNQAMINATREYDSLEAQINAIEALRIAANGSAFAMDKSEARRSAEVSVKRMYYPLGTGRMVLSRLATPPFADKTGAIKCPALILHADEDPIFSIEHGEDMARRLGNAELTVLPGAGHNHPASLQPIIAAALKDFAEHTLDCRGKNGIKRE